LYNSTQPTPPLIAKEQIESTEVKLSKKWSKGLEDGVSKEIAEHRPLYHPFERSGPVFTWRPQWMGEDP
jgi:hypothetical protein